MQEIVPVDFRRAFCPLEGGGGGRHTGTRLTVSSFEIDGPVPKIGSYAVLELQPLGLREHWVVFVQTNAKINPCFYHVLNICFIFIYFKYLF